MTHDTDALVSAQKPIEMDGKRAYIPLPGGWEIQTKGGGSTFRIALVRGPDDYDRWPVLDAHLHDALEKMGRDIHDAIDRLTRERDEAKRAWKVEVTEAYRQREIYAEQAAELAQVATDYGIRAETGEAALSAARAELAECKNRALEECARVAATKYCGHGKLFGTERARSYERAGYRIAEDICALKEAPHE